MFKRFLVASFLFCTVTQAQTLIPGVYVGNGFDKKLLRATNAEVGLSKSVYYRSLPALPLATGPSLSTIRLAKEIGAKNITVEVRGTVGPQDSNRIFFGPYTGGADAGYSSLVGGIHSQGMASTLKLVLVTPTGEDSLLVCPNDYSRFWESYSRFAARYAKVSNRDSVAELVVGTGLGRAICDDLNGFVSVVDAIRYYYAGRLRLDFIGLDDFMSGIQCLGKRARDFDAFGLDFADGTPAGQLFDDLMAASSLIKGLKAELVASRVSFTGPHQEDLYEQFFELMSVRVRETGVRPNLTIGIIDVNPDRATPNDQSANIVGKPAIEKVKAWFGQF